jgi:PAS domain S-box-containing protein
MTQERILIVDDEADIGLILKLQLEDAGYATDRARDGLEALEILSRERFSLVLLDIKMPKMDGIRVLERLGASLQDMAVVMMTAHGSENVAVESMKKGALDYISKPFSADDLLKKVERSLEFNRTRRENRQLQQKLEEQRQMMEAILQGMADIMVAVGEDGRVISINRAAEEIFGIGHGTPLGMPVQTIIEADLPPEKRPCMIVLQTLQPCIDVTYNIRSRGRSIPVLSSAAPLVGISGRLLGSVEIIRDISYLKAIEREREEFVGMLTHDLKNPLTAVMGSIDLVRERRLGPINDDQKEYLDSATESCGEIVEMIDTLLDVYRFESGQMTLELTPEALSTVFRKVLASFHPISERAGIRLSSSIPEHLPVLHLDRTRVVRLFGNLLSNAFKFTQEGGEIRITAELVEDGNRLLETIPPGMYPGEPVAMPGRSIVVRVRDTGIGIPPDALGTIFDKFVQAKNRRMGMTKGTGLGLAFCRKVMDAHGGFIWAESEPGIGSTFTVLFPLEPNGKAVVPGRAE